nr:diterpene synthase [Leersia tisserantii]
MQMVSNASVSSRVPLLRPAAAEPWQQFFRQPNSSSQRRSRGWMVNSSALGVDTFKQARNGYKQQTPKITMYLNDNEARGKTEMIAAIRATLRTMREASTTYTKLFMVDTLAKVGVSHYFSTEITSILDMAYNSWQQKDQEMIMDMETCGMAFRILRMHGYDVSSDVLAHFSEVSRFSDSVKCNLNDTKALLELYKASKVRILEDECNLDKIGSWTAEQLRQQLCSGKMSASVMPQEVECALQLPFYSSTLEPLEHRRNIQHFSTNGIQMQKPGFLPRHAAEDIVALAVTEFNSAQSLYQKEVEYLDRWVKEVRLDQLKFLRILPLDVFFFFASSMFPRESSEARMAAIQNCILTIAVDDLFDVAGSNEELENLVALFEKWDAYGEIGFCSENVETIFNAVYNTSKKIETWVAKVQNRSVMSHIAELWLDMARVMKTEAEWSRERYVPTMEEYMPVAEVSFALGPIVPTSLYLMGPELTDEVARSGAEFAELMRLMNVCCRLLNDMASYKREWADGKINSVLLHAGVCGEDSAEAVTSSAAVDAAKEEIRRTIEASKRELLRLVTTKTGGTSVPRVCKDVFWNMCKVVNLTYAKANGYCTLEEMMGAARAVVREPLKV